MSKTSLWPHKISLFGKKIVCSHGLIMLCYWYSQILASTAIIKGSDALSIQVIENYVTIKLDSIILCHTDQNIKSGQQYMFS